MAFAGHFHVHDEFSPLDGTGNRNQLTREAVKHGHTHLGCTNHGRLGSILDHYHACRHPEELDDPDDPSRKRSKDERLIPIFGIEAFWRPDRFMDLTDKDLYGKNGHNWAQHLCFHAGSLAGWRTLMRLSSKSWVKREQGGGYYGKPCFDWDMIEDDNEDLLCSTACLASPLSQLILSGDSTGARKWCERMMSILGENRLFFEIMPHDIDIQRTVNLEVINLANELGRPFMVTGDVHMPYKDWVKTQSIVRMASYQTTISKQDKKKDAGEEVYTEEIDTIYLSSEDALAEMFEEHHPDIPASLVQEGLDNTEVFAKNFRGFVIGKAPKLPKVDRFTSDVDSVVKGWIDEGWKKKLKTYPAEHWLKWDKQTYIDRREMEWKVLKAKNVIDYFYIVGDFVRWAKSNRALPSSKLDPHPPKKRPIRVGLGRGSAAGCLISNLIGITAIDPISWGMLFERFLNPDRVGMPDIDIDFETDETILRVPVGKDAEGKIIYADMDGRQLVIEYLRRKYGHDHVAAIIAYQTFAPRAVIKAVLDTQDFDYAYIKKITDSIGDTERNLEKLAQDVVKDGELIKGNEELQKLRDGHPDLWQIILNLEDQILRDSRHAGGIIITDKPTNYYMPTQIGSDEGSIVTAWADRAEFPIVSDHGFLKNDILGVKSLTKQEVAVQLIAHYYDEDVEPNELAVLRDPWAGEQKVIDAFVHGLTFDVFQFAGEGITKLLRHIRPDSAMDIAVANALFRPGPIKIAFEYGDRKNGKTPITYWHDALEPILGETLGLMCFQEQAMEVVKRLANFSGGDADNFRKIMSKLYRLPGDKAQQVMQKDHDRFIEGCMANGVEEESAEEIWSERMLPLGNYLFNKSHAGSYGLQAYQDMFLKINYPLAFYASSLTVTKKSKREEKVEFLRRAMREASIFDVHIDPPDVNRSGAAWTISGKNRIRYGMASINGMGYSAAKQVIEHRPFDSYDHFLEVMPSAFGSDSIVTLAKAGALDELEDRSLLLGKMRQWPENIAKYKVTMTCGCKKQKQVKVDDKMQLTLDDEFELKDSDEMRDLVDMATELAMETIECKKHPDATAKDWEELDPLYFAAQWMKDNPNDSIDDMEEFQPPSHNDLLDYEEEALHVPLSLRNLVTRYKDFIDERIFETHELDDVPAKPPKKNKEHGSFCPCEKCEAAQVVVGGEIVNMKVITTKRTQEKMAFVDMAFGVNTYSVTLFPYAYKKWGELLRRPTAFLVAGHKDDRNQIIPYDIRDVLDVARDEDYEPPEIDEEEGDLIQMGGGIQGMVIMPTKPRKKKVKINVKKRAA